MAERPAVRGSMASHAALVAVALGIAQIASYAVSVVAARALGPDGFGILAALLGILLIGSVLAMGIQAVAARRLVRLDEARRAGAARAMRRDGLIGGRAVAAATVGVSPLRGWRLRGGGGRCCRCVRGWPLTGGRVSTPRRVDLPAALQPQSTVTLAFRLIATYRRLVPSSARRYPLFVFLCWFVCPLETPLPTAFLLRAVKA